MPLTPEQRAAGWIEHDGKGCPVPLGSAVKFERRGKPYCGGSATRAVIVPWYDWAWREYPQRASDIIAYRMEAPDA